MGSNGYLTLTVQQPGRNSAALTRTPTGQEKDEQRGYMGYIGPLPAAILSEAYSLRFDPVVTNPAGQSEVVATARVCARPSRLGAKAPGQGRK